MTFDLSDNQTVYVYQYTPNTMCMITSHVISVDDYVSYHELSGRVSKVVREEADGKYKQIGQYWCQLSIS